jgi:hypothetical protein
VHGRLARMRHGPDEEPKSAVFHAAFEAAHAYVLQPRPYSGKIVLFLGSRGLGRYTYWRQAAWSHVAGGGLEVRTGIDGCLDHVMMLGDPPHVRALAERLGPYLERAASPGSR